MKYYFTIVLSFFILNVSAQILSFEKTQDLVDSDQIEELAKDLKDKHVVFIGDIIHGEANIDSLRAVVIKYLISEHGFNTIAFESGIYDLYQADQALKDGQRVYEILTESIYGVWHGTSLLSLAEIIENNKTEIQIIGFDPKFTGIHYSDIDLELGNFLEDKGVKYDQSLLEEFQDHCASLALWEVDEIDEEDFFENMKLISQLLNAIDINTSENDIVVWKQVLLNVSQLFNYLKNEGITKLSVENWKPSDANTRDSLMAVNLKFYLDLLPNAKIVCWGASAHFAKSLAGLSELSIQEFQPMGSYFEEDALFIGSMGYSGKFGWSGNIKSMPQLPKNSVEYHLHNKGLNSALVDLQTLTGDMPLFSSSFVEIEPISGDWTSVFDWVLFVDEVIPKTKTYYRNLEASLITGEQKLDSFDKPLLTGRKNILILKNEGRLIEGTVQDEAITPIPYSSVALKGSSYGVISDQNGSFSIKIPNPKEDTLVFSNVAYETVEIPVKENERNFLTIVMKEKVLELPEIIISSDQNTAQSIVSKAIENIEVNYINQPFSSGIFNRKWKIDTTESVPVVYQNVLEAYYPNGYSSNNSDVLFQSKHSRKGLFNSNGDSVSYSFNQTTGLNFIGIGLTDFIINRRNSFLDPKRHKFFNFKIEEFRDGVYEISFTCDRINPKTTGYSVNDAKIFRGKVYVTEYDYAIVKIETELIWDINKISRKVFERLDIQQETLLFKTIAEYVKSDGKYHIAYLSRFENYNDFGFSEYNYLDVTLEKKNSFESNLTNSASNVKFDWSELIKKVDNKH